MYIVSWYERGRILGSPDREKTFSDEKEAHEFYKSMKSKETGVRGFLRSLNPIGTVIENVRIRRV